VEYVDRKEDPVIQIVRTQQYYRARRLKTALQSGTRQLKDSITQKKKKDGEGSEYVDNCHAT
jgi:hypothetical protein